DHLVVGRQRGWRQLRLPIERRSLQHVRRPPGTGRRRRRQWPGGRDSGRRVWQSGGRRRRRRRRRGIPPRAAPGPRRRPGGGGLGGAAGGAGGAGGATTFGGGTQAILPGVRITADVANNTLLIYANQENYRVIERTLRQLDRPQLQVAIDTTIAEVVLNNHLN